MLLEGIIGLGASVLGAALAALNIRIALRKPIADLQERVHALEGEKISDRLAVQKETLAALERRIEQHLDNDQGQRILTLLQTLQVEVSKQTGKLDKLCEDSARQQAQIDSNAQYIRNLDASFERHKHNGGTP